MTKSDMGIIAWHDLTVKDASGVGDFYARVCGWGIESVDMGDYADFAMSSPSGAVVAGICHARGANAKLPPRWLPYVSVSSVAVAIKAAEAAGGALLDGPRQAGDGTMAVLQDPAGACFAVWEAATETT